MFSEKSLASLKNIIDSKSLGITVNSCRSQTPNLKCQGTELTKRYTSVPVVYACTRIVSQAAGSMRVLYLSMCLSIHLSIHRPISHPFTHSPHLTSPHSFYSLMPLTLTHPPTHLTHSPPLTHLHSHPYFICSLVHRQDSFSLHGQHQDPFSWAVH